MRIAIIALVIISLVHSPLLAQSDRGIGVEVVNPSHGPQKWAFVVGVSNYDDEGLDDLPNATNDAWAVAEMLKNAPGGFPAENLVLLSDGEMASNRKPTRSIVLRHLNAHLALTGPEDTLLVYFAGHGVTEDGELFLLPADAAAGAVKLTGISYAEFMKGIEGCRAKRKIVILDACHSATGRSVHPMSQAAIAEIEHHSEAEGTVTLPSCGADEVSHESDVAPHGAFTYFLLQGLAGEADIDFDGYISASELAEYTWDATRRWAGLKGLKQTPWKIARSAGEILLVGTGGVVPVPKPPERELPHGRFVDNKDGTVLDTKTRLLWQAKERQNGEKAPNRWAAKRLVKEANAERLGGRNDWRIPTKEDMLNLDLALDSGAQSPFTGRTRRIGVKQREWYWLSKNGHRPSGRFNWERGKKKCSPNNILAKRDYMWHTLLM